MDDNAPMTPTVADLAAALEAVGADLADLQTRVDGDPFATTHAYAAILAARADLNQCLDGLPVVTDPERAPVDITALTARLDRLITTIGQYARESNGTVGLACARAALHVDDARGFLADEAR